MRPQSILLLTGVILIAACGTPQQAAATPNSSPVSDYGAPPSGVPLFYLRNSKHPGWYDGYDWIGRPRATIKLAAAPDETSALFQSPDGSAFILTPGGGKGGFRPGTQFLDRIGVPLPNQDPNFEVHDMIWADDSTQTCTLDAMVQKWRVGTITPGRPSAAHSAAVDLGVPTIGVYAQALVACSPRNDVAIVSYAFSEYPTYAWVVRLSDGRILRREAFERNAIADIAASPDGKLLAESSNTAVGYVQRGAAAHTTITDASTGANVATLPDTYDVLAFSADDSVALVTTSPWVSGAPTHLALIKVESGVVVWRYDGDKEYGGRWIQPGGSSIAVMLQSPAEQSMHVAVGVVIVHGDGSSATIAGTYVRA